MSMEDLSNTEAEALVKAASALLSHHSFEECAREIFDRCKNLIGAKGGVMWHF